MTTQQDTQHPPTHCPYLGAEAGDHRFSEAVEYPSFENRCWTTPRPIPLLLTDQATLCLCSGFRHCPRYLAARAARQGQERPATIPAPADTDAITQAINELEADVQATSAAQTQSRRRWGWIGAGLIFMSSLLCGGFFAAYVGWQMVREELAATQPGNIDTLTASAAQAQTNAQPQFYIFVTATSEPQSEADLQRPEPLPGQALLPPADNNAGGTTQVYPEAVPPTPAPDGSVALQPPPSLAEIAEESNAGTNEQLPAPTPVLDFELEVPTRRPTPFLDIPTSTPASDATATPEPTMTPVPPLGTPVVIFYAEDTTLQPGDCTNVSWHVENVKAVYYENLGVDGRGTKEECVRDDMGDYNLMVILPNGATQWYTVTVGVVPPTDTPAPTPTRTEEPPPTPTWTPNIPTATPTPPTLYGARLEAGGDTELSCTRGTTCELDFYASNTGSGIDNISIRFTEASAWPRQLCRLDGVCSDSQITLVDMGPSNTGVVRLRVTIPQDAETGPMTYKLQAVSDGSTGDARSDNITIQVTAKDESAAQVTDQADE
jgi:hypothetical protein